MIYNVKLNLNKVVNTLKVVREYLFPIEKVTSYFKSINSKEDLQKFIQQRSAHITQTTLYGYLKTRMGHKFTIMVDDDIFSKSINIAKWNMYSVALQDLTFYSFSYMKANHNYQDMKSAEEIFSRILDDETSNKMPIEIIEEAKKNFYERLQNIDWDNYHSDLPFNPSALSLYKWAPIAEELKALDRKIVLNSVILKWDVVKKEFAERIKF